jgi:DNA-binding SARP family transcriptional activator
MPFAAKSAMPCEPLLISACPAYDHAADGGLTLLSAPPGYLLGEDLAASLARHGRSTVWLRLGNEDRDPGTLLASLVDTMRYRNPALGNATAALMRREPGPVAGWQRLFECVAAELGTITTGALVLEHIHHLDQSPATLALLGTSLLPQLPPSMPRILTSHRDPPPAALPPGVTRWSAHDLRIDDATALERIAHEEPSLNDRAMRRAATLCQGRAAALAALHATFAPLGARFVEGILLRAKNLHGLLGALGKEWLEMLDPTAQRALGLGLRLGYVHPALLDAAFGSSRLPPGPWLQALADGWWRIRTEWSASLRVALGRRNVPSRTALHRAAEYLVAEGAIEQAVSLHLELGDAEDATLVIARAAEQMLDLGQWELLAEWLDRIPDHLIEHEPSLVYCQAEIHAALGRSELAERRFTLAASLFDVRQDADHMCRTALAESALASRRHDAVRAEARARTASAVAEEAGILWHRTWSAWQLGALSSASGRLADATTYFSHAAVLAAEAGQEPAIVERFSTAEALARRLQELQQERRQHQVIGLALQDAEREVDARLTTLLDLSLERAQALTTHYTWSQVPLALRLPVTAPETGPAFVATRWWSRLHRHATSGPKASSPAQPREPVSISAGHEGSSQLAGNARGSTALSAHLLGRLRVTLNGKPIDEWHSSRSRSLLGYLLTHRDPWPSREVLMSAFWPNSTPQAARNSLNVAVHGLRRVLSAATDVPVVVFQSGSYQLRPDITLWLDVEEFERHVEAGLRLEAAGDFPAARGEYESAVALYQGDLLADDPYEEWPLLDRERLRVVFLDVLDRLGQLYFTQQRYAPCAALCLRIIERDPCREDAHRRLMRCYERQGQPHLALRQYRVCAETLRAELDVDPAPATTALYEQIRAQRAGAHADCA